MAIPAFLDQAYEWLLKFWGFILVAVIILFLAFYKNILNFFGRKKKIEDAAPAFNTPEITPSFNESLFALSENNIFDEMQNKDVLSSLKAQKAMALKHIKAIEDEGKRIVQEEKNFTFEIQAKRAKFSNSRMQLGVKHTLWANHLKAIENSISQSIRMQEEMERLKKVG